MDQLEYLESERKKLWEKALELQDMLEKRTADYEHEARQASKKSSEYKNRCDASQAEAKALVNEIQGVVKEVNQSNVNGLIANIKDAHEKFIPRTQGMEVKLRELERML